MKFETYLNAYGKAKAKVATLATQPVNKTYWSLVRRDRQATKFKCRLLDMWDRSRSIMAELIIDPQGITPEDIERAKEVSKELGLS
jgi:hypothetical protein